MNPKGTGRDWQKCDVMWLLSRLKEEVEELEEALESKNSLEEAPDECADVANFAMMISDNLTSLT